MIASFIYKPARLFFSSPLHPLMHHNGWERGETNGFHERAFFSGERNALCSEFLQIGNNVVGSERSVCRDPRLLRSRRRRAVVVCRLGSGRYITIFNIVHALFTLSLSPENPTFPSKWQKYCKNLSNSRSDVIAQRWINW